MAGREAADAFALMWYEDELTGQRERLWNSRDGVTPFVISSRASNPSKHVDYHLDVYAPDHVPAAGDRVFVDATPERVRPGVIGYVEHWWDAPTGDYGTMRETMEASGTALTKEEAVEHFVRQWCTHPGSGGQTQPYVAIVTEEMRFVFAAESAERKKTDPVLKRRAEHEAPVAGAPTP